MKQTKSHSNNHFNLIIISTRWITLVRPKFIQAGYPSRDKCPYSFLDFECDEEFASFLPDFRSNILVTVRLATPIAPLVAFSFVENWLTTQLQKAPPQQPVTSSSPFLLEWETLAVFLDAVISRFFAASAVKECQLNANLVATGLALLEACLKYRSSDPLILSSLLSCISSLLGFVQHDPQRLPGSTIHYSQILKCLYCLSPRINSFKKCSVLVSNL